MHIGQSLDGRRCRRRFGAGCCLPEDFSSGIFFFQGGYNMENLGFILVCILTVVLLFLAASLFEKYRMKG